MTEPIKGRLVFLLVLVATAACSGAASDSVLDNPAAVSSAGVSDSGSPRADSGGHGGKTDATTTADSSGGGNDAGDVADANGPMGDDATVPDDAPNDGPADSGVCPSACGFGMICCTKPASFAYRSCVSPFFC